MSLLAYLMNLSVWSMLLTSLLFVWGFHQHRVLKLNEQIDAIQSSIALHHLFKIWAKAPKQAEVFQIDDAQLVIKNKVGSIQQVNRWYTENSFAVAHCPKGVEHMMAFIWNANQVNSQPILKCSERQLVLQHKISITPPFQVMIFYPIQLRVNGSKLYLKFHENSQVWMSGFESMKFFLQPELVIELKWRYFPLIRWQF